MTIAIPRFPATNNEQDVYKVFNTILGYPAEIVPHYNHESLFDRKYSGVFIPGGFSFGDHLRAGAIAAVSEMVDVIKQKNKEENIPILGVCNGFQILTEAGMLPGVLLQNPSTRFICKWVHLRVSSSSDSPILKDIQGLVLSLPIAHYEGQYNIPPEELQGEKNNMVLFQYCSREGCVDESFNPNGSVGNIAGVGDDINHIYGCMPHPERASSPLLSSTDGLLILRNFIQIVKQVRSE